ncbi:hypothetical protein SODALDRAFT_329716 [Sodiomyces alkalinus F11]|uniref:Glucan 1, 4-alpha-glucosidase n=1 Tax=Sodiomyces alkalinus (strain CBS 110278 / VKM F-3762 / F11) TaxID=1314773 RepID=A0A3N2PJ93_SODAK|nr:hypothetical protein SODALDRAFT_329716 [Sodiomyces alkalinus F11]ROT34603.1 hypothetical protein SODALDRAFT_329716 [Sodiomyces alkalinus F11]
MEDPWGSPWETHDVEDSGATATPTATSVDANPEPPPPAFFTPSTSLTIPTGHSVWVEDDPFGEWAAPEPSSQPIPASGWGIWGGRDSQADSSQLTPRYESKLKTSSPRWPSSRSTSPGQPSSRLRNRSSSDQLSLDPWASEPSTNITNKRGAFEPSAPLPQIQHLPLLPENAGLDAERPVKRQLLTSTSVEDGSLSIDSAEKNQGNVDRPQSDQPLPKPDLHPAAVNSPSKPSASEFDLTEVTLHEPPSLTPPADDAVPNNAGDRQVSKVHQLVEMYDDIARKNATVHESPPPSNQGVSASQHSPINGTPSRGGVSIQTKSENTLSSFPTTEHESSDTELPTSLVQDVRSEKAEGDAPEIVPDTITIDHEPFYVDYSHLDHLFPGLESNNVTGSDVEVPDHIITDNYESISERKMWYRISRFGPSRTRDLGEDDHFTVVTWSTSTVRSETIQIVRRWMEEDSICGRTFRGGLANGANGRSFGWGQKATPVDFQRFFSPRTSTFAGRPTPVSALPADAPDSHLDTHSLDRSPVSMSPSTVGTEAPSSATFGWANHSSPPPHQQGVSASSGMPAAQPKAHRTIPPPQPPEPLPKTVGQKEMDDDEWGDMVTPSTTESRPISTTNDGSPAGRPLSGDSSNNRHDDKRSVDSVILASGSSSCTEDADQVPRVIPDHNPHGTKSDTESTCSHRDLELSGDTTHSSRPSSSHVESTPQQLVESPAGLTGELEPARRIIESLPDLSYMLR